MKLGLVCEGGGMRGSFSSGVFDSFLKNSIRFKYVIGVSAGASNAVSYISGQYGRNKEIVERFGADPRYVSYGNLFKTRSMFGYDFLFKEIPGEYIPFDHKSFQNSDCTFYAGAMDCETGQTVWFPKDEVIEDFVVLRASCSIPFVSEIVEYKGYKLLDGGVSTPIPIEKSLEDGNDFNVIVLTRNEGYRKQNKYPKALLNIFYKKYPKMIDTILNRAEVYNKQIELCERLEREGRAIILRPQKPLEVGRYEKRIEKLLELYDEGVREADKVCGKISELMGEKVI